MIQAHPFGGLGCLRGSEGFNLSDHALLTWTIDELSVLRQVDLIFRSVVKLEAPFVDSLLVG